MSQRLSNFLTNIRKTQIIRKLFNHLISRVSQVVDQSNLFLLFEITNVFWKGTPHGKWVITFIRLFVFSEYFSSNQRMWKVTKKNCFNFWCICLIPAVHLVLSFHKFSKISKEYLRLFLLFFFSFDFLYWEEISWGPITELS